MQLLKLIVGTYKTSAAALMILIGEIALPTLVVGVPLAAYEFRNWKIMLVWMILPLIAALTSYAATYMESLNEEDREL